MKPMQNPLKFKVLLKKPEKIKVKVKKTVPSKRFPTKFIAGSFKNYS